MIELKRQLTAALKRLSEQYAREQRRQSVRVEALRRQIERQTVQSETLQRQLSEQVTRLAESYRTLAETSRGPWI